MSGVIALDIGGVCVQLSPQCFLEKLGLSQMPDDYQNAGSDFECGRITPGDWLKQCRQRVPALQAFSDPVFWNAFRSIIGPDQPGMAELVKSWVEDGYKIVFFSNTSIVHADEVWKKISFGTYISGGIYSYEVGSMKPEATIYRAFEEQYGKPALYLDDNPNNVAKGLEMGWNAKLFTGNGTEKLEKFRFW